MTMYAAQHDGVLPKSLNDTFAAFSKKPSIYICPSSKTDKIGDLENIDTWSSYEIVPAANGAATHGTIIVQEKLQHAHIPNGRNYFFADGKVTFIRAGSP
jgi:hypothetical protein